ncbi:hypothetical protein [Streptomyces sp. VRA16 Mangrove soil]|uniref:hypothetical protein n=1 Tax=Streptomyces sp. VRA16 Mangrove soil TaxID=2817434 RepID=UPI001A9CD1E8|nr:hypothetical protein [Streptomyces sp. VRA16 Mangrove soil]MBO1330195.1 hypothetical protein [Streptomyces sp. VRA16 Mangrove soil]
MNHPHIHACLHAARAAELRAQADAHRLRRLARTERRGREGASLRHRFGWLLIETGLRFLRPPRVPRPAGN